MQPLPKNISFRRKLLLINLAVAGMALLLVVAALLFDQYRSLRKTVVEDIHLQAQIIGANTTAALAFDDDRVGNEILAALQASTTVEYAAVFDTDGRLFAAYRGAGLPPVRLTLETRDHGHVLGTGYAEVIEPVVLGGETLGYLVIRSNLEQFWQGMARQLWTGAAVLAGVFTLVLLLLPPMQRAIATPLVELARLMRRVSTSRDYSVRAVPVAYDEIGQLAQGFNDMLGQIQQRDHELEQHRQGLEQLVDQRTTQLQQMATHDALTGLPNRVLATDRLAHAIADAERNDTLVALLFLDLDRFKEINDTLGHGAGDQLLRELAVRFGDCLRKGDTVARFGGDEFVLVMGGLERAIDVEPVVLRLLQVIAAPVTIGGRELHVSASIGIALYPQDGGNEEILLRNADTAMYRAKELGRDNHQYYTEELNIRLVERTTLLGELRRALEQGQFLLHYQPQADMAAGRIVAMEALLRWEHPRLGLTAPGYFIQLAEESGLIVPIGIWVLREACRQLRAWHDAGLPRVRVAVNVAARQLDEGDIVAEVAKALSEHGLAGEYLELELTETDVMANPEQAAATFSRLHALGVSTAIDDFGMGYSSLSYLKRFSFDRLKIDQSFVRHMVDNPEDAAITRTVIAIGHSLGLAVIAEGVETAAAMSYLWRHGCREMQGYLISRPLPAADAQALLRSGLPASKRLGAQENESNVLVVVDDEPNFVKAVQRALKHEGYTVLGATTMAQAFEQLALHEAHVLLCDQRMPEMMGTDFLAQVRDMYPETVRVMLTAYPEPDVIADAINRGAVYKFLTKPLDDAVLRREVADAFAHYRRVYESG